MTSNSKLNPVQRISRKNFLDRLKEKGGQIFNNGVNMVVIILPMGHTARVSTSVMSPTESKFRRKVGEYHALVRLCKDECIVIPNPEYISDFAYDLMNISN